jgi:threonine/homoserine/homoserine lactone efflux protein
VILPEPSQLLLFMSVGFALNITPGPDMLYIIGRSVAQGRRAGVASALGVGTGALVHILLVAVGLASMAAALPAALTVIRLVGAGYLVYLGVRALRAPVGEDASPEVRGGTWAAFRQGALTNVLNPKVALFFLAFLPQFVDASRGSTALQVVALGLIFDIVGTIVNLAVALGSSGLSRSMRRSTTAKRLLNRLCGVLFIGLGIRLALTTR